MSPPSAPPATRRAIAAGVARRSQSRPHRDQPTTRMPLRDANRRVERLTAPNGARSVRSSTPARSSISARARRSSRSSTNGGTSAVRQVAAAVQPQLVPGRDDVSQQRRVPPRLRADHVERRPHAQPLELGQHGRRALGVWPVVERERHGTGAAPGTRRSDPGIAQPAHRREAGRRICGRRDSRQRRSASGRPTCAPQAARRSARVIRRTRRRPGRSSRAPPPRRPPPSPAGHARGREWGR